MYAGKNKSKNSRSRNVDNSEESLKLSSKDARYDAGDYEAVPASIRKARETRRKQQQETIEEQNAIPASEIIAQQEAEIERLKKQVEQAAPKSTAERYRSAVDDNEEHPTFKNPESMADFGDYEAVAASARFDAASHDPNQKVFRAKPTGGHARKIATVTDLGPDDYEAVAAGARKAVPPDEYKPVTEEELAEDQSVTQEGPAEYQHVTEEESVEYQPVTEESFERPVHTSDVQIPSGGYKVEVDPDETYMTDAEAARIDNAAPSREAPEYTYTPDPEPEEQESETSYEEPLYSEPASEYAAPESESAPKPVPAPVSAADYMVNPPAEPEPEPEYRRPPAPVSAEDYTVQSQYSTESEPEPEPAYTSPASSYREPEYTSPAPSYTAPEPEYTAPATSYAAPKTEYSAPATSYAEPEPEYAAPSGPEPFQPAGSFTRQSSKRIANVIDIAPGDYEAVAVSSADDSDMDFVDGSYDFDKFLSNAPTLHMQAAPAPSPEESDWADLRNEEQNEPDIQDEPDITEEQTRQLTEALAQEALSNQPGTQFEDIIDNVIAKVLERKKAEDAAKAAKEEKPAEVTETVKEPEKPAPQPEEKHEEKAENKPAESQQNNKPEEPQPEQKSEEPAAEPLSEEQPQTRHELTPDSIPDNTPIDDIPALLVAELDSIDGDVSEDDIKKTIDAVLITRLTSGELTLDSVQPARNRILSEIKEMQEEEARILAELSGEKHEFRTDFLPHDIALEDIPDAIINELDHVEGEVSDDEVKKSIDTLLIAKLASGELTLDSYQSSRDDIFDALGIEQPKEEAAEAEPVAEEETAPAEEEKPKTQSEHAAEETEPEPEPVLQPINTENVDYVIDDPTIESVPASKNAEAENETVESPALEEKKQEKTDTDEEEPTVAIPVPKEPTVLEYDPLTDTYLSSKPEEPSEFTEEKESEEYNNETLSAAAVLSMSNEEDNMPEPETETEAEPADEKLPADDTEPEAVDQEAPAEDAEPETEQVDEELPADDTEPEAEPQVDMQMTFDDIFRNPFVNDFEPLTFEDKPNEPEPSSEEETQPEPEPELESVDEETSAVTEKILIEDEPTPEIEEKIEIDEIFKADEEPAEKSEQETESETEPENHSEIAEEEKEAEEESQPETEPESVHKSEEQTFEEEEKKETPEAEPVSESEKTKQEPELEATDEEEPKPEPEEAEDKTVNKENLEKYGVNFVSEEEEHQEEELKEYSEAKIKRHEDMQNALLMAMVDGTDKSFSEAVNDLMQKADLNAKTLRSRMPIDREQLDKVLSDPEFKPDKKTAIAICFALRLTWEDSVRLLYKAGYVLSDSQRFDLTIEYLMRRGVYDQNMINSVLRGGGLEGFGIPQSEI